LYGQGDGRWSSNARAQCHNEFSRRLEKKTKCKNIEKRCITDFF
jgi:hypothetical protein